MNLNLWAEQYREQADLLEIRLATLKTELKSARGEKAFELEKRIQLLSQELYDVRRVYSKLNHYYDRRPLK